MKGFIKLDRCLLSKNIFHNEKLLKVWVWCLLKATHKEHTEMIGRQEVTVLPGQFVTGRHSAGAELSMSPSTAWTYLKVLEKNQSIDIKSNSKFSLITVINWAFYQVEKYGLGQQIGQQKNSKKTANGQQKNTNNNDKNVKNDKKDIYALFDVFWKAYPKKKSKEDARKAWKKLKVDDALLTKILSAIEQAKKSKDWLKDNGQFIPHPATWLNGKRWEDDYTQVNESEEKGSEKYGDFYL